MFHFPTFPPHALCVQARVTPHDWCGVPPFGHPRINARLAAPRGLSQPPTSFIGSWCPGIHRVPLTTWPHNYNTPHTHPRRIPAYTYAEPHRSAARACNQRRCSRPLCSSQRPTGHRPHRPAEPHPPATTGDATTGWYEDPNGPDRDNRPPRTRTLGVHPAEGPLPQDPTACLRPPPPRPRSPHPPPTGDAAPY
jgi:hypothetical protein